MNTELEEELQRSAVAYIRRHSMHTGQWKFTLLGELHVQLCEQFATESQEKVIVSSFRCTDSWYVFTTRRLVSKHAGVFSEMEAAQTVGKDFGNFKGYDSNGIAGTFPTAVGTVEHALSGITLQLEFETLYASMAIIYACKFWERRAKQLARAAGIDQLPMRRQSSLTRRSADRCAAAEPIRQTPQFVSFAPEKSKASSVALQQLEHYMEDCELFCGKLRWP